MLSLDGSLFKSESDPNILILRTYPDGYLLSSQGPDKDYLIQLNKLSPEESARLVGLADGSYESIRVPESATKVRAAMDLHSDCSEAPVNYDQIKSIGTRNDVQSQQDFINAIPPGTLQTFTLVYDSNSLQKPYIDKLEEKKSALDSRKALWPRVLRMSEDGKLIISYTCDPQSSAYGTVEIIKFDDKTSSFKFSELDYRKQADASGVQFHRLDEHPVSCSSCHAPKNDPENLRPNMPMYETWLKFYGTNDDSFFANSKEGQAYLKFKEAQKNNPCYSTLPWPKDPTPDYTLYPYSENERSKDLHVRANVKFTKALSRLEAKRVAVKFISNPNFSKIKYLLAAESIGGCDKMSLNQNLAKLIPGFVDPFSISRDTKARYLKGSIFDPGVASNSTSRLYEIGTMIGVKPSDWTLTPLNSEEANISPIYNPGVADLPGNANRSSAQGVALSELVQAEIMEAVGNADPTIASNFSRGKGESEIYGKKFSCIDDLGGEIFVSDDHKKNICQELSQKNDEVMKSLAQGDCPDSQDFMPVQVQAINGAAPIMKIISGKDLGKKAKPFSLKTPDRENGKKVVTETCMKCHITKAGMEPKLAFFENPTTLASALKSPEFRAKIDERLRSSSSAERMPLGRELGTSEISDVEAYLAELVGLRKFK